MCITINGPFTGITVNYAAEMAGKPSGPALLRFIILLWTGDYPAQSEVAKFICHGIRLCCRCVLEGISITSINLYYCICM